MQVKGTSVFVTGGVGGIGRATVEALLKEGAKIAIADVDQKSGEEFADSLQEQYGTDSVLFVKCDVTDDAAFAAAFKQVVEKFGHIDLMINNAGILNESKWKPMVAINFNAVVVGTQLAIDHMRKDKGGRGGVVINISSTAGLMPVFFCPIYTGTKHAVIGFTRSWAEGPDVPKMGIRFGIICPTGVDTPLMQFQARERIIYHDVTTKLISAIGLIPATRVAEGILKLILDDDSNGAILPIMKDGEFTYKTPVLKDGIKQSPIASKLAQERSKGNP